MIRVNPARPAISTTSHWKQAGVKISDIEIEVVRRNIRHVYLRVSPDDGAVQVRVPRGLHEADVQHAVEHKLDWIRRQRKKLRCRPQRAPAQMISGESHFYFGEARRLEVIEVEGAPKASLGDEGTLRLQVRPGSDCAARLTVLEQWYRMQLKARLPGLVQQWEPQIGVRVAEARVKRMKTRWGSCNIAARRIWLNLALARWPVASLEYIVVHEMVHLLERYHNRRFRNFMDRFLPDWRQRQTELNNPGLHRICGSL